MITRRLLLGTTLAASALFAWSAFEAPAMAQGADATGFVVQLGNALVGIVNGAGTYEEKKRRLAPLVESAVDVDGIARFCLGRYARNATPQQLQEYQQLFHSVLLNNIFGKIGEFQGVTFRPTTTTPSDEGTLVGTLIQRPNQQANNVQWVVASGGGQPKIIDVKAEGTSLRLTQRNDYASYIGRNGGSVDALIAAMKQQIRG